MVTSFLFTCDWVRDGHVTQFWPTGFQKLGGKRFGEGFFFLIEAVKHSFLAPLKVWECDAQRKRQWHSTPVLLPGKSHGQRSLVGCSPWGRWVGHDSATSLSLFTFMHWRRKRQPTPVFLPGESQGRRSLVGYRLWGHTESDTTDTT